MMDAKTISVLRDIDKQQMFQDIEELVSQNYIPGFQLRGIQFPIPEEIDSTTTADPIDDSSTPPPDKSSSGLDGTDFMIILCVVGYDENGPIYGACPSSPTPVVIPDLPEPGGVGSGGVDSN